MRYDIMKQAAYNVATNSFLKDWSVNAPNYLSYQFNIMINDLMF